MLLARETKAENTDDLLLVNDSREVRGSIRGNALVQSNCSLHVRGNIKGTLTIESGATVVVEGSIGGKVTNRGGKLEIRNRVIAEFVMTEGPPDAEASGILKIDLSAIAANWNTLAKRALAECAAVVKANAYGCGIDPISGTLAQAGCNTFFVSDLPEARCVRVNAPNATIYVINGLYPGSAPALAEINSRPVIGGLAELAEWDAFVSASGWTGGCALSVDTYAGRIGISFNEAAAYATRSYSRDHGVTLLVSHLENTLHLDRSGYERQVGLIQQLGRAYGGISVSLANSAGIFADTKLHCDLVRSGSAIYGLNPAPGRPNPMLPVIELQARILKVLDLAPGEKLAYNSSWTAKKKMSLAIVGVGYADGYPLSANTSAYTPQAIVGDKLCPLVGGVSMDMTAIDVTALSNSPAARRGQMVTLIGGQIPVDDMAAAANTSGRAVLSNLGRRFKRLYHAG
jgi:alanine racemase